MVNAHEIFVLLVSTGVLVLTFVLFKRLVMVPFWKILLAAFLLYYSSTVLTVLEGFFLPDFLNFLEHFCRALFPGFIFLWIMVMSRSRVSYRGRF